MLIERKGVIYKDFGLLSLSYTAIINYFLNFISTLFIYARLVQPRFLLRMTD